MAIQSEDCLSSARETSITHVSFFVLCQSLQMEEKSCKPKSHKEWRRVAKRERRRRIRQKAAQLRDADEKKLTARLEKSTEYLNWLVEKEKQDKERESIEKREHEEKLKLWLEEEAQSQKEWLVHQERRAKAREEKLQQEEIIRQEFEAKQRILKEKQEEAKRIREEELKRCMDIEKEIDDYIDNGASTPVALRAVSETQSGREPCPFFEKTGACRYGDACSRNHRRVALSKIILIPGFYSHFSMEKNSAEYDTDISLEFEGSEMRQHFYDFYREVLPELESFGIIKTLRYCCNRQIHLRGNLYVEYQTEREAARAWRKLKGRYFAKKQLNCYFVNFASWRNAVCGMTKCPKGRACNYLHTLRNPNHEYDIKSPPRWARNTESQRGNSSRRSER